MLAISKIKELKKSRKLSNLELAKKIGLSKGGIDYIFNNNDIKLSTLQKMADYFQVPITHFLEETERKRPDMDIDKFVKAFKEAIEERL